MVAVAGPVGGKDYVSKNISLLLVEDEALLHVVLEEGLGAAGFDLVIKGNGASAFAELDADASRFGAVLTDIRLGKGPSGWDVGRRARELVSQMPVIYMSGDSCADWASKGVPDGVMIPQLGPVCRAFHFILALGIGEVGADADVHVKALSEFRLGIEQTVPCKKRQLFDDNLIQFVGGH